MNRDIEVQVIEAFRKASVELSKLTQIGQSGSESAIAALRDLALEAIHRANASSIFGAATSEEAEARKSQDWEKLRRASAFRTKHIENVRYKSGSWPVELSCSSLIRNKQIDNFESMKVGAALPLTGKIRRSDPDSAPGFALKVMQMMESLRTGQYIDVMGENSSTIPFVIVDERVFPPSLHGLPEMDGHHRTVTAWVEAAMELLAEEDILPPRHYPAFLQTRARQLEKNGSKNAIQEALKEALEKGFTVLSSNLHT